MFRLLIILFTIILALYFIRGIVRTIVSFFNRAGTPPPVQKKTEQEKNKIPYDKSKVVDAEFEDIK